LLGRVAVCAAVARARRLRGEQAQVTLEPSSVGGGGKKTSSPGDDA
jgi:hypothetical protein